MISLKDIIALLDRWDVWKRVAASPDRIDALERRLKALERSAEHPAPKAEPCPYCAGPLRVTSEIPDPVFGRLGHVQRTLECQNPSCGQTVTRKVKP